MSRQFNSRLRILFITQFFPPETGAASLRTASVVDRMASDGHEVTVLTTLPSFPTGSIYAEYRGRFHVSETRGNVSVERVWTYASPKLRRFDRLLNWIAFAICAVSYMAVHRMKADILYVSFPPVATVLPAVIGRALYGAKLIVDIRDVLPDRATQLGVLKATGVPAKILGRLVDGLYRRATLIATLNETCRQAIIKRAVPADKVIIFPNGFDPVTPSSTSAYQRQNGEFVAAYVGNIGMTSGVDVLLDAAKHLRGDGRFRFVVVGGGNEKARLQARIEAEKLDNVTMLGARSYAEATAVQLDSDVCIIPLRRGVIDTIPKKLYDAMSLSKPVIVCATGEAERFVSASRAGLVVEPENGKELANAVRSLSMDPQALRRYGENARTYVTGKFERAKLVDDFVQHILGVLQ